jgi:hypothetical protein
VLTPCDFASDGAADFRQQWSIAGHRDKLWSMNVGELIESLKKFDPKLKVAAHLEHDGKSGVYEFDLPTAPATCRRSEHGGIAFVSATDPNAVKVVLLELEEA